MTLAKQLTLLVILLVLLLFAGTLLVGAENTRQYLQDQLASHAQDAATSLGMIASNPLADQDRSLVATMVNAMFHRGDFLSIRIEDLHGETLIERSGELGGVEVPDWFRRQFELAPPIGDAVMMQGWRQVGRVEVISHPGLAYLKLWEVTQKLLLWYVCSAAVLLVIGLSLLRWLLKPLRAVEAQAAAICNREFPVVEQQPFTLEFRRVVGAMNKLASKVSQMLIESDRLASRLREQAYQDPVTGLANRRQFMDVLLHRIEDKQVFQYGGLLLLQIRKFKEYNQKYGYQAGDVLLQRVANVLVNESAHCAKATVAHLNGADFALLVEDIQSDDLARLAEQLAQANAKLCAELDLPSADVAHVGGSVYADQTMSELLSTADLALRQAQRSGANASCVHNPAQGLSGARTASDWRDLINAAISQSSFRILRQPVCAVGDKSVLHEELFLRLVNPKDSTEVIAAGVFMPMADAAGLGPSIDRWVLQTVLQDTLPEPANMAVNMSPDALLDDDLLAWLSQTLRNKQTHAQSLILEWSEYAATAQVLHLQQWITELSPLGVRFSLDHFGRGFSSFAYLSDLKAHMLKVDGSYIKSLDAEPSNQFFLQALVEIARGLEMQVLAESVESEAVWQQLEPLGVDGGRGFWLGEPK